ncbi:glycosyl hydrolase [Streptomyces glebosus]|uniref:Glycosyl hydrolase n=1 Tax=Streptomyces glebosus TaxID=249580 RepID=A0A640T486_9ACTN|nr:beta-1,3-glucanase family protein [Streptomyces glebosus]GFE17832.1 glycosyl hydrolase [Streptomyces glebosus]GHG47547.1 glycosyl hydrolase [Streptomyces glebosus]
MITRRSLLGGLAAGAAASGIALAGRANGVPAPSAAPRGPARSAAGMPLHLVNNSGSYANSSVWIYVVGNDGTQQVHVTPDGELKPVALADNGPDGFTDYAIPLAASGTTTLQLPRMSGRIYTALGAKLKFKAVEDGNGRAALAYPAGWVAGDPNYDVLHDCAEFTYNSGGMYCNTTMVDMFSVPLAIQLTGAKNQTTGTLKDGARAKVFADVRAAEGFDRLVIGDRRVIAPGHGLDSGLFAPDYLAPAIDEAWSAYGAKDLSVTTNAGTFTGRVRDGKLVFTVPQGLKGPSGGAAPTGTVSFDKPSTRDVLFCDGTLAAPNDGTLGPIAAILGAALNRSTLTAHAAQPTTDPATFYRERLTHHYAKAMHAATRDGRAYGFAFDDVAGFASYIEDPAPKEITLTLTPF